MLSVIESVNAAVNNFIWGVPAMICIIGAGLYLSIRTNFLQIPRQAPCDGFSNGSIVIMRSVKHTISIIKMFFEHYAEIVHGYDSFSLRKALGDTPTNFLKNEPRNDWLAKLYS